MGYDVKNYRPCSAGQTLDGTVMLREGQILGDLYYPDGSFYRTAVVADLGRTTRAAAERYCQEANAKRASQESPQVETPAETPEEAQAAAPAEEQVRAAIRQISDFHSVSDAAICEMYDAARKRDANDSRKEAVDLLLAEETKSRRYDVKNYRPIFCAGSRGQILGDLYRPDGSFFGTAVVADLGRTTRAEAERYCREANAKRASQESPQVEDQAETPAETPVEAPEETPVEAQAATPAETPVEAQAAAPAEEQIMAVPKPAALAQRVADVLNEAYRRDPSAMHALVVNRVPCNDAMADDPYVICEENRVLPGTCYTVGLLGVLNGVLNMLGIGPVGITFESNTSPGGNARVRTCRGFTAPVIEPVSVSLQYLPPEEWLKLGASQQVRSTGCVYWVIPTQLGEIRAMIRRNSEGEPDASCGVTLCRLGDLHLETLGQLKMLLAVAAVPPPTDRTCDS